MLNDKVELVIASFAIPLFVVAILFVVIILMSIFSPEQTVEEKKEVLTEVELENEFRDLIIDVEKLNLHFIEGLNRIYHSKELSLRKNDKLMLTRGDGILDRLHLVDSDLIIQNNYSYNRLDLRGEELEIDGEFSTDKLEINSLELDLDTKVKAGKVDLIAEQITAKSFFESEKLQVEGAKINIDLELMGQERIEIIADELDSSIQFKEQGWIEGKELILKGAGKVEVLINEVDKEGLDIESSPEIELEISYY